MCDVQILLDAITRNDLKHVDELCRSGVNINGKNSVGFTAIYVAADHQRKEILTYLIEKKADLDAQSDKGDTALIRSAMWGDPDIVWLLLDAGADYTLTNDKNKTALELAVEFNETRISEMINNFIKESELANNNPSFNTQ